MQRLDVPADFGPILQDIDSRLLDRDGRLKLLPAQAYADIPHTYLMLWCYKRAIYQLPTQELIDWLDVEIGSLKTIEIGAGRSCVGLHLGIPQTDACYQRAPETMLAYAALGQVAVDPFPEVDEMEASSAIDFYQPECVFGTWVTQRRSEIGMGNPEGIDEEYIIKHVKKYIVVGNRATHDNKLIVKHPHRVITAPWLVSRSQYPDKNCIYVWDMKHG